MEHSAMKTKIATPFKRGPMKGGGKRGSKRKR